LEKAKQINAMPIDFTKGDPVEQIIKIRKNNPAIMERLRPGEEKMPGVMSGIDAVGYQALDRTDPTRENPRQVIDDLACLVNPTGMIGLIGVYFPEDPGAKNSEAKKGEYVLPLGQLWRVDSPQQPVRTLRTDDFLPWPGR
jgi:glutathione-independent formaldehyde dehydrogenase